MPKLIKKTFLHGLAYALPMFSCGCTDYLILRESALDKKFRFAPSIDAAHLSPHPTRMITEILVNKISVGTNCKGQAFRVPPIEDRDEEDTLYYLWFLDNKLVPHQETTIDPATRKDAIITLTIDQHFLRWFFKNKIPKDFFDRPHAIDFFVSDVEYTIAESRYINYAKNSEKDHSDHVYWIVSFSDDPC